METLTALASSIICRYIEDEDIALIAAAGTTREAGPGEKLFDEGDPGGSFFVILQGKVDISKRGPDGSERHLASLMSGDIIGELSLVDASPRSAMATTASACSLFELSRRDLMGILRSDPNVAAKVLWAILETVSLRLRDMNEDAVSWRVDPSAIPRADL